MVIIYRIKSEHTSQEKCYILQRSTFPFLWLTVQTFDNKVEAQKACERANRIACHIM
jgi:hypothetical protein